MEAYAINGVLNIGVDNRCDSDFRRACAVCLASGHRSNQTLNPCQLI
jgi:hypothetical protein